MEFLGATMQQNRPCGAERHQSRPGYAAKKPCAITVNYTPQATRRQFMNELNSGLELLINLLGRAHRIRCVITPPDAFGPKDL